MIQHGKGRALFGLAGRHSRLNAPLREPGSTSASFHGLGCPNVELVVCQTWLSAILGDKTRGVIDVGDIGLGVFPPASGASKPSESEGIQGAPHGGLDPAPIGGVDVKKTGKPFAA